MSSLLNESDLRHENAVVWLENPDDLDHVRRALGKTPRRRGKHRYERDGRMGGYAELDTHADPDPDSGLQPRCVLFLLPHDRDADPDGPYHEGAPGEAVDPRTIRPQRVGDKPPALKAAPQRQQPPTTEPRAQRQTDGTVGAK